MTMVNPQVLSSTFTMLRARAIEPRDGESEIDNAVRAIDRSIEAANELHASVERTRQNADVSELGKTKQIVKSTVHYGEPALETIHEARKRLSERSESLVSDIKAMPDLTPDQKAIGVEIRAHFKALESSKRMQHVLDAMKRMDETDVLTIRSLLDGPTYLTGLDAEFLEKAREQLHKRLAPTETQRRERIAEMDGLLATIERTLQRAVDDAKTTPVESRAA
ncbi:hypothetical protein [Elongatibacter sediminis]|uniref:Uncharacterized protein n=1 Tax=Elongatibacter sediminis TaxID=3119006 RepID=A0AAW9RHE0_9GAMM